VKRLCALALLFSVGGCAYYNGLYNANRLVGEARKAEREGRGGVARSMWNQVVIKTDTVLARYPRSAYRDDALFLKGLALSSLGSCPSAIEPLQEVVDSSPDPTLVDRGRLQLGRCMLALGRNDSALIYLTPLSRSESEQRDEALLLRGRALHRLGSSVAARTDLEATRADSAGFDLALVLLALRDPQGASRALEPQLRRRYDEGPWLRVLDTLGFQDPDAASQLAQVLVERRDLTRGQRARLLVADGLRFELTDTQTAIARYDVARRLAGDSIESRIALVRRVLVELTLTADTLDIPRIAAELRSASVGGGAPERLAVGPLGALDAFLSDTGRGPIADLNRFVVAERLRDAAGARRVAATLFAGIAREFPGSVIAPKALIAAADADASTGGELVTLLQARHPEPPHTLALMGMPTARYALVEDSLLGLLDQSALRRRELEGDRSLGDEEDSVEFIN
jgi:tetratricopeptide (TPR) repeat protein